MIEQWFPTLIYSDTLEEFRDNNQHFAEKAYEIRTANGDQPGTTWNCDTYNTLGKFNYKIANDGQINRLVNLCKSKVLEFSKEYGVSKNIEDIHCDDLWFNISSRGNYQEYHQHSDSHFSLVYYVKAEKNCGNILFRNIESFADMCQLPIDSNNYTAASYKTCFYTPKESMILIFRSNLLHMVEKNNSDSDRITIAMNFKFT
jgi:uncharacterized protein (TIGR02466 family)